MSPSRCPLKRALISVFDKTALVPLARSLHCEFGIEIISTGGTAAALGRAGIPVTEVESLTGFPEMLDGRVKTLHPRIHGAILADRDNPDHMRQLTEHGIGPIDLVVVNLYPFERTIADQSCTFEQAIEMIDIGGPCLLRAAAKNHRHVVVVCNPADYEPLLSALRQGRLDELRPRLARAAFEHTSRYDAAIAHWLAGTAAPSEQMTIALHSTASGTLRYGENPHQTGRLWHGADDPGDPVGTLVDIGEVPMSYNNYVDASAARELCAELHRELAAPTGRHVCCLVKHTNACGVGVAGDPLEAYRRAYLGDPNAAMGGILAVSFPVDVDFAAAVLETYQRWGQPLRSAGAPHAPGGFFVEVWLAPRFEPQAVELIRGRVADGPQKPWGRRVRLLATGEPAGVDPAWRISRIAGGYLTQSPDTLGLDRQRWQVVTEPQPDQQQLADLRLAWLVCKHTKSNAITICRDGMLLGSGAGQMSRVMSCRLATWLARENGHADRLTGAVAASDAFFPFADGPELLARAGVKAIIQPGGSKRDAEVIAACNHLGVAMIFTGVRHFRH